MATALKDIPNIVEMQDVGLAASQALTDAMVERLVTTASHGLEVLDRLNDDETRAAVHRLLDGLTTIHTTGALDAIFQIAEMLNAARSAMTDQMIERLYHFMETMVTNLATQDIAELARDAEQSLYDAAEWCDGPEAPKGMLGVLRSLSKPETVQTLNLLLAFGNAMRERTKTSHGHSEPEISD